MTGRLNAFSKSLATLCLILLTEPLYCEPLYTYSLTLIPAIQQASSPIEQSLWYLYSNMALFCAFGLPFLHCFFWRRDYAMTVYYCVVISALTFSMNFLKLRYHDPRPFWSSDAVQAFSCSRQYGNPSGHTMTAFCALIFALEGSRASRSKRVLVALGFGVTVAYSRLFLGVHSLD